MIDFNCPYVDYPVIEEIDFDRTYELFQRLALFDDIFLLMQAQDIAVLDPFLTQQEYALLEELLDIERTPTESAMFVSALSRMWIFSLYEVLRTWRQRIRILLDSKSKGTLQRFIDRAEKDSGNTAAYIQAEQAVRVREDVEFANLLEEHKAALEQVYRCTETLRICLAKQEKKGDREMKSIPRRSGYGRINPHCGAIDFEVLERDGSIDYVNRRVLAEMLRAVRL